MSNMKTLTLAAGCFWCLEAVYSRTRGVSRVESGYIGGDIPDPTYAQVASGMSGHAEAVRVTFDPAVVPEDVILGMFFTGHDPTSLNRQGNDVGTQYRSAMFYEDAEQKQHFQDAIAHWQELFPRPMVTTLEPMSRFYVAEDIHQNFYGRNPGNGYCMFVIDPKLAQARARYAEYMY
ncbi:peptide-methionine (S)-S-oxide reductase [Brevibacterium ravenspurgense]|uniref:Peptide methionine sulfoxide reductase MsrA n=2 Tax=Brevibacteriaceae TaxID=85019 RepID=A0A2I1IIN1_9MICO|nr:MULTISPECIES: peptide-methionine (S)-S-oxide reductase MsrA [Brevibacterium]OFT91980.1 peptide-methionine (S)-S-oxide reductase [Brevibacterium sp. HMSC24B04]PKY70989.1 peptide-methionine (S)-S-oxide reductase [Brevibacterium ravenspurgense]